MTSGVPQGSILSPLLFLVYANDMAAYLREGTTIALFADDSKLYRPINSVSHHLLQSDLSSLHNWIQDWDMAFSSSKCKVLHMSRKKISYNSTLQYHMNGLPQKVFPIPQTYIGVIISKDLSWTRHIEEICTKENKTLGLVKRVCGRENLHTKLLYFVVVRPRLEYASQGHKVHPKLSGSRQLLSRQAHLPKPSPVKIQT